MHCFTPLWWFKVHDCDCSWIYDCMWCLAAIQSDGHCPDDNECVCPDVWVLVCDTYWLCRVLSSGVGWLESRFAEVGNKIAEERLLINESIEVDQQYWIEYRVECSQLVVSCWYINEQTYATQIWAFRIFQHKRINVLDAGGSMCLTLVNQSLWCCQINLFDAGRSISLMLTNLCVQSNLR